MSSTLVNIGESYNSVRNESKNIPWGRKRSCFLACRNLCLYCRQDPEGELVFFEVCSSDKDESKQEATRRRRRESLSWSSSAAYVGANLVPFAQEPQLDPGQLSLLKPGANQLIIVRAQTNQSKSKGQVFE